MNLKAIFFDMDGVLIDSMSAHVKSWKESLEEEGIFAEKIDFLKRGGMSFKDTVRDIAKMNLKETDEKIIQKIHERKKEILNSYSSEIIPFEIVDELQKLKEEGVKMYVVTSSPSRFAKTSIEENFPNVFEHIISRDEVGKTKPHPEPYLKTLEISGFKKEECIVVEDAPLGIKSGKSAGIKSFAICTSLTREYLHEADMIFESHKELFDYIESNLL